MLTFIASRFAWAVPVLLGVSLVVFSMIHLIPGDPVEVIAAETFLDREGKENLRHQLGLDRPLPEQYFTWMGNALRGDFGRSIRSHIPVEEEIASQLPRTLELAAVATLIGVALGLVLGVTAAVTFGSAVDHLTRIVSLIGVAMPSFWLGILLILLFSVLLRMLPIGGQGSFAHLVMPALTLGLAMAAIIARTIRAGLLDVLGADYIRTARAKGLHDRAVVFRHALRNALIPTVTVVGLQIGVLLSGTMVVETVFSRQGLGRLTVSAVLNRDFPMVQGTVLISAVAYVAVNLIVDLIYGLLDPRVATGSVSRR